MSPSEWPLATWCVLGAAELDEAQRDGALGGNRRRDYEAAERGEEDPGAEASEPHVRRTQTLTLPLDRTQQLTFVSQVRPPLILTF